MPSCRPGPHLGLGTTADVGRTRVICAPVPQSNASPPLRPSRQRRLTGAEKKQRKSSSPRRVEPAACRAPGAPWVQCPYITQASSPDAPWASPSRSSTQRRLASFQRQAPSTQSRQSAPARHSAGYTRAKGIGHVHAAWPPRPPLPPPGGTGSPVPRQNGHQTVPDAKPRPPGQADTRTVQPR